MYKNPQTAATWWTLEGFTLGLEPEAFHSILEIPDTDWDKVIAQAGYSRIDSCGDESISIKIEIYEHVEHDHYYVQYSSYTIGADFFVKAELYDAFIFRWYLKTLQEIAAAEQSKAITTLTSVIIAFVRQGHGRETVNANGDQTQDDVE